MDTSISAANSSTSTVESAKTLSFWESMEFNRYGYGSALLIFILCFGGLTAGFGGFDFLTRVIVCIVFAMGSLVSFITLAPIKVIFGISGLALIVNLIFIIAGALE